MTRHLLCIAVGLLLLGRTTAQPAGVAINYFNEAVQLKEDKKYVEAVPLFKKAIQKSPELKEAYYEIGWCLNELGKYNEALAYLQKAKQKWPEAPKVYFELGYSAQRLNKPEEAKAYFSYCLLLREDYALAHKYLGHLYFDEKNYKKALEHYELYGHYEHSISDEQVYYNRGFCQIEEKNYNDAIPPLREAIKLKPDYYQAYNEIGYAQTELSNPTEAIESYHEALSINPESSIAYIGLGDVYKDLLKNTDEALDHYLKAIALDPESAKINYSIGWCYNDKKQYKEAIGYLEQAAGTDSKYQAAITELGYSYFSLKNYEKAQHYFKRSLEIERRELPLYYSGLCYFRQGQKAQALKVFEDLKQRNSPYAPQLKDYIAAK